MDAIALARALLEETIDADDLIRLSRRYIQRARELLLEKHRGGAGGVEIVSAYTTIMDHLVRPLFAAAGNKFSRRFPGKLPPCPVVAQGGYGRGELNPQSDIDLLFLYSWKVSPFVESVTERILYTLWDTGLQVGSAVRTIAESIRLADADLKVKTAILDTRFLCGDFSLYGDFEKALEKKLIKRRVARFIHDKQQESRLRHESYGGAGYLLGPQGEEGGGGLRGIPTARWIGR